MKAYTAYAIVWTVVSIGIIAGMYLTKNASCLWAFIIPAFINVRDNKNDAEVAE